MSIVIENVLIVYLALMNIFSFAAMGWDKRRAVRHRARTPERRLLLYAIIGGSPGAILGMLIFRHKTKHLKFTLGLPVILVLQIAIAAGILMIQARSGL